MLTVACAWQVSCGEPLPPAMRQLGMAVLTHQYVNVYWSTERGGFMLAHGYGNGGQPLRSDAHMNALPWVKAEVWCPRGEADADGRRFFTRAAAGADKGLLVSLRPYPSMARTVWSVDGLDGLSWRGDHAAWRSAYFSHFKHDDGSAAIALNVGDLAQARAYRLHRALNANSHQQ